jgi:RNA polymerase sporulation-specific sigma factor
VKQGLEAPFQLMVDKYKFLIAKKIRQFNLIYDFDDCYQESLILLHKSIIMFDCDYGKTFTRFYEMNLTRFLISYKKRNNNYFYFINERLPVYQNQFFTEAKDIQYLDDEIKDALAHLSDFEKRVYQAKIIELRSVKETAKYLQTNEKRIYNALDRIKNKIKLHLIK